MADALTFPLDCWISLGIGSVELQTDGYTREPATFDYCADGRIANIDPITWQVAQNDWGAIDSVQLWDAPTAGFFLGYGTIPEPITIGRYDRATIPPAGFPMVTSQLPMPYGVRTFGTGHYATYAGLVSPLYDAVGLQLIFDPVALCGGVPGDWAPHGPFEVA